VIKVPEKVLWAHKNLNFWGSHLPALVTCVAATEGPVLELGAGYYSTPILHAICAPTARRLVSVESDGDLIKELSRFRSRHHHLIHSPNYEVIDQLRKEHWSVVLLDQSPGPRRGPDMSRFDDVEYFVVHDIGAIEITNLIPKFRYCKEITQYSPPTGVYSNVRSIPEVW